MRDLDIVIVKTETGYKSQLGVGGTPRWDTTTPGSKWRQRSAADDILQPGSVRYLECVCCANEREGRRKASERRESSSFG